MGHSGYFDTMQTTHSKSRSKNFLAARSSRDSWFRVMHGWTLRVLHLIAVPIDVVESGMVGLCLVVSGTYNTHIYKFLVV